MRNDKMVNSLDFLFVSHTHLAWMPERSAIWNYQQAQTKELKKSLLSLAKGPGQGKFSRDPVGSYNPCVTSWTSRCSICWQQWQQNPKPSQTLLHNQGTGRQSDLNTVAGAVKPVSPCPLPSGIRRPKPSGFCFTP